MRAGDVLRVRGQRVRIRAIEVRDVCHANRVEHVTLVFTRTTSRKRTKRVTKTANVVRMPAGDSSIVGQFIRYHVLVRVYDGDPDAWLAQLRACAAGDPHAEGDIRFVHWIRSRLRQEPMLLASIRRMVDATPFWRAAEA